MEKNKFLACPKRSHASHDAWRSGVSFLFFIFYFLFRAPPAHAVCPVCTIAVGAGLGLSRYLGIDDTVSGLWVGGLILSSSFWLISWLAKKGKRGKLIKRSVIAGFYILTVWPLYQFKIIGHPKNSWLGIDKLILGIIAGSFIFYLGVIMDKIIRKKNDGKVKFYYQKVILPVSFLLLASVVLYFVTRT